MKKWITTRLGTQNGETLEIIFPFEDVDTNLKCVFNYGPNRWFETIYNARTINMPETFITDSLKESIRVCKLILTSDIISLEDPRTAPPSNTELYIVKCKQALITLKEMYCEEYPEEFV